MQEPVPLYRAASAPPIWLAIMLALGILGTVGFYAISTPEPEPTDLHDVAVFVAGVRDAGCSFGVYGGLDAPGDYSSPEVRDKARAFAVEHDIEEIVFTHVGETWIAVAKDCPPVVGPMDG